MRLTQVRASFGLLPKETAVGQKWCFYSGVSRVDSGCVAGGQWVCRGWAVGENKRITGSRDKPHLRPCHIRGLLPKMWFLGRCGREYDEVKDMTTSRTQSQKHASYEQGVSFLAEEMRVD